jgi:hypothetical protein
MPFKPESRTMKGCVHVAAPIEEAFQLFSPLGELAWVPEWQPELLWPPDVEWAAGQVFRTRHAGQESVWFVAQLDRQKHEVTYHRVDAGVSATSIHVACEAHGERKTVARVEYRFVGITDEGNAFIRTQTQDAFDGKWVNWEKWIAAALSE